MTNFLKRNKIKIFIFVVIILVAVFFVFSPDDSYEAINTSRSSFITNAQYSSDYKHLVLGLNGNRYDYCGVPGVIWEGFVYADSLGSFYNSEIKGDFSCDIGEREDGADPICLIGVIEVSNKWLEDVNVGSTEFNEYDFEQRQTELYNDCLENRI